MVQHQLKIRLATSLPQAFPAAVSLRRDVTCPSRCIAAAGGEGLVSNGPPLFLAYSCTKTFIAALVLRLCERERLSLTTPLCRWFPEVPQSSSITIRHLLNHTSGIPDYGPLAEYHHAVRTSPSRPWSTAEFLERTVARGLLFEPGEGWCYSNVGYLLLKEVVELEENDSLRAVVAEQLCRPLALRHTFVAETLADLRVLQPAVSRRVAVDEAADVRTVYHPGWVSHGVVASTPAELAEFYHRLLTGTVLGSQMLAEMLALTPVPGASPNYGNACYGLGLMADTASRFGMLLGHNGGGPGYEASVFHAPDLAGERVTACAMSSCEDKGVAEQLVMAALALAAEVLGEKR